MTTQERQVLRWLLLISSVIVVIYIAVYWWQSSRACSAECIQQGFANGELQFSGGGRFNMKAHCQCVGKTEAQ
jgi:DNA-binding transcriptional regulator of glucitol operon